MTITENVSLAPLTTFRAGGSARYFCKISSVAELAKAFVFANEQKLPVFILGGGSNVLVSDDGFPGLVIKNEMAGVVYADDGSDVLVTVAAGESWDGFVAGAVAKELWGVENLSGIPGTVGAAPIQNIGAYGTEVKDVIEWVEVYDTAVGKCTTLSNKECNFNYRTSIFKKERNKEHNLAKIITRVCFRLTRHAKPNLTYKDMRAYFDNHNVEPSPSSIRDAVLSIRATKFPDTRTTGTAGSFFTNPIIPQKQYETLLERYPDMPGFPAAGAKQSHIKVPLAWILDNVCNLKGVYRGDVGAFERQPLVIVNKGNAHARDIKKFADSVAHTVKEKTHIVIEPEVTLLGFNVQQ